MHWRLLWKNYLVVLCELRTPHLEKSFFWASHKKSEWHQKLFGKFRYCDWPIYNIKIGSLGQELYHVLNRQTDKQNIYKSVKLNIGPYFVRSIILKIRSIDCEIYEILRIGKHVREHKRHCAMLSQYLMHYILCIYNEGSRFSIPTPILH